MVLLLKNFFMGNQKQNEKYDKNSDLIIEFWLCSTKLINILINYCE